MKYFMGTVFAFFMAINTANSAELYLFYSAKSDNLKEIGITKKEVANVFDGEFGPASDELPLEVRFDDFYVAKFPDKTLDFMKNHVIDTWTYNKAIQKMLESFRVSKEHKMILKNMKIK